MPLPPRLSPLSALAAVLLLLVALPAFPADSAGRLRVLATTYPVYLLTRAVAGQSPRLQVELLIPAQTGCPHDYALTPDDMRRLAGAQAVVMNGLGLEGFMDKALAGAHIPLVDSSVQVLPLAEESAAGPSRGGHAAAHGGHQHGAVNPHAFASPAQAARMVRAIGQGLARALPEAAQACPAAAEALAARLEALSRRLAAIGAGASNRRVASLHDGLAYLLRDAGLELVAVVQEGEDVQPSAARLIALARQFRASPPALLLGEPQYADKPLRALAAETGIPVLLLDPLASGPADAPTDHYERVMAENCRKLGEALGR